MPEVDLTIIANNQEFMKTMSESRKAEGDFYSDWQKNMTDTADQHEDIMKGMQDELKRLGISEEEFLKKYKQAADGQMGILEQLNSDLRTFKKLKESATTTQDIEKFNKKIGETQKQIDELGKKGAKSTDSFDKLKGGFIKLFGVIGGGYAIIQGAKKLIESTGDSTDSFKKKLYVASAGVSFFLKSLVSGDLKNFGARLDEVIRTTSNYFDVLNRLQNLRRSMEVQESKNNITIQAQLQISDDVNKSYFDRIRALVTVNRLEKENAAERIKLAEEQKKNLIPVIQSLTGLTEQQIGYYVEQYKNIENVIEIGNKYNALLKERKAFEDAANLSQQGSLQSSSGLLVVNTQSNDKLKEINKSLSEMGKFGEFAGKLTMRYGKQTAEEWDNLKNVYIEYNKAVASGDEATRVSERRLNTLIKQNEEERLRKKKETDDKIAKNHAEFLKLLEDLQKRYQEAQLEGLSGKARIDKEQEFAIKELDIFKKSLEAKEKLTKDQYAAIEFIRNSIVKKGDLEREKLANEQKIKRASFDRALLSTMLDNAEDEIDLSRKTEEEKLQLKIDAYQKAVDMLSVATDEESKAMSANLKRSIKFMAKDLQDIQINKEFDFEKVMWKALGIDIESPEGQFQAKWVNEWANNVVSSIGSIIESEANLAAQRRQNAENRISELESQLDKELELQEEGLANNVNAVKKELEQVKAEKQRAQEQEKQLQQAQIALDTVTQISSLITASTNIFKAFSAIPIVGVPLAIAAIATMFGFMAAAKIKAVQSAKLEQGGYIDEYGVIQGKRHSDGGEALTKHIEVEQGEGVGVFNRGATQYYGGMLPKWVQSINNKKFPKFGIKPEIKANQIFDLKTSSMNSELKAIKIGIDNLNSNLLSQTQTNHKQGVRIEKQGNRTRIVHEKN